MTQDNPIRILMVDDHAMMRIGLATFLASYDDFELVGEASSGVEAVELCEQLEPEVVLMDLVMQDMDGVEATQVILSKQPDTKIIALTSFEEADLVRGVLQAGAVGYLLKGVSSDDLARAIRAAVDGTPTLSPEATQILIEETRRPTRTHFEMTDRELEILALIADGLNNREIADQLFVSRSTIKTHVSNILTKLGVSSRTEAVAYAIENDLISR
jgi:NarL family two-component system response regulator LiaR